jgi:hypothetical protein
VSARSQQDRAAGSPPAQAAPDRAAADRAARDRAARVLAGAAVAEAAAWTGLYDRARLLPPWTRRKRREIEHDHDVAGLADHPVPFALNQPTGPLRAAPGPRSEWIAFALQGLSASDWRYERAATLAAWRSLAGDAEPPRLSLGQRAALDHLLAGREPPRSGHDHARYADDAACVRSLALAAALAHDPDVLLHAVREDAVISNAEDGVWCAEAIACALAATARGEPPERALELAAARLPVGSWSALQLARALRAGGDADDPLELALRLDHGAANAAYSYGDAAPDVVTIALTIFRRLSPRYEAALLAALAVPRHAAAVLPVLGALLAADAHSSYPSDRHLERLPSFLGIALPRLRGQRPTDVATTTLHEGD